MGKENEMLEVLLELAKVDFSERVTSYHQQREISGVDALMLWQYVRLNKSYHRQYDYFSSALFVFEGKEINPFDDLKPGDSNAVIQIFQNEYGISFPVNYKEVRLPKDVHFLNQSIHVFDAHKLFEDTDYFEEARAKLRMPERYPPIKRTSRYELFLEGVQPLALIIDRYSDKKSVLKAIDAIFENEGVRNAKVRPKGSSGTKNIVQNLACYWLKEKEGFKPKEIHKFFTEELNHNLAELKSHHIKQMIDKFKKDSQSAPWSFIYAAK